MRFILKDIRFWLLLFFVIRLYGITNAPLESHNWRQTTVTMVARNFLEQDNNILYPRLDNNGEKSGITGMEFPILNYSIYGVSKLFGYQHWYGRLINLILSTFGIFFFFKIAKLKFPELAFNASLILLCSIWFAYSRKIMPDTFATSLMLIGIYWGIRYMEAKKITMALLFVLFVAVGALSKIPVAFLLSIFALELFTENKTKLASLAFFGALALTPAILWYFYWVPHLNHLYQFPHFFMGTSLEQGLMELASNSNDTLKRFYEDALKFSGFALFILGLIYSFTKRNRMIIGIFLLTFISFFLFMAKSGYNFSHHSYYIIPFVPVMALIASYGISNINRAWLRNLILLIICLEGILNQVHDFRLKESNKHLLMLEQELDKVSSSQDLILINSANIPTSLYFANRKGWTTDTENLNSKLFIQEKQKKGLKFLVILHGYGIPDGIENYQRITHNSKFSIYRI